ncbi:hypothetical protein PFMC_00391 [Plasmodium falciparum CAMP/Malaysia]|uniref:Uncharacterized protein n=1 Tax=Plasmodium falciparum (isolate Camp / Malaysia) TaxID=5835 RepID=A0A024XDT7_PLAFC|nr:hypothetical protein PFMC_00391 [Plasmodium falciparum CAMP/Malaysia]
MHCASKAGGIECGGDPTPEDYIPQRLRWLSEWADNYCKMVKTDYKSMSDECKTCKKNGANFAKGSPDCTKYIMVILENGNLIGKNTKKKKQKKKKQRIIR